MTPERWQQVKSVLAGALEREDRTAFINEACAGDTGLFREVQSLLAQPEDQFESCAETMHLTDPGPPPLRNRGRRLGAYELQRELGRGGMGTVWLARRADQQFEKLVAIKLLKRGTDTDEVLRRFQAERRILARLEHPNIARLLDGGTTAEGLPYFVMEYVEGTGLIHFVRDRALPLPERLQLFLKICGAVQFAHQNLVVHRDLKPGNILVTAEREPKLLDFGIAKLLGAGSGDWEATLPGRERLTAGYASPEQVRSQPVTTVSDVYALGALLYEVLTERPAHRFSDVSPTQTEILRVVCHEDPMRPSLATHSPEFRRQLRGDLDTIVLRALAKEPARRYPTAASLADDLRRYLAGRPVQARPDSRSYRARKFVGRNKISTAAVAVVLLAIVGGAVSTLWHARRAERRFDEVRKMANTLIVEFHDAIRDIPGTLAARQLVTRRAVEYLDRLEAEAGGDLTLRSELALAYGTLGNITFDTREALETYRKSVLLNEALVAAAPKNTAYQQQLSDSYNNLCHAMRVAGRSDQAIVYAQKALALAEALVSQLPTDRELRAHLAQQYSALAFSLVDAGDARAAVPISVKAVETHERVVAENAGDQQRTRQLRLAWGMLSYAHEEAGMYEVALEYARRSLASAQPLFDSAPSNARFRRDIWAIHFRIGRLLAASGDVNGAFHHYAQALQLMESLSSADPNDEGHKRWLAVTSTSVADLHAALGQTEAASGLYRKAMALSEGLFARDENRVETRRDLTRIYHAFGVLLMQDDQISSAEEYLSKAHKMAELSVREDPTNARVRSRFADVCAALGSMSVKLADGTSSDPMKRRTHLQSALEWYQRSSQMWASVDREGKLLGGDARKPHEVARELASCATAMEAMR